MIAGVLVPPPAVQAPAQAASNVAAGTAGWTPEIYPLCSGEWAKRDVSSAQRPDELIARCWASGIACVAVGQGDGKHGIFHLFKCDTRSLSNFVDALSVRNNQTGAAQVRVGRAPAQGGELRSEMVPGRVQQSLDDTNSASYLQAWISRRRCW
ncbi:hypothetical protein [Streptomyces sp. NPDC088794]|uniref:hypothetical protein n=1 Tax=Streptomyces sp. NPDC088794 TaxID=3365902 RepID=UPI00382F2A23